MIRVLALQEAFEAPEVLVGESPAIVGYQKFLIMGIIRNPALSGISDTA